MKCKYEAGDGKLFDNEAECLEYEAGPAFARKQLLSYLGEHAGISWEHVTPHEVVEALEKRYVITAKTPEMPHRFQRWKAPQGLAWRDFGEADAPEPEPVLVVGTEPGYWNRGHYCRGTKSHIDPTKVWGLPVGTKLYTAPPASSVPDGWRPVPLFATVEMRNAGRAHLTGITSYADSMALKVYGAMVAAAPAPTEPPADVVRDAERLDWLDKQSTPHGLGWEFIQMPAGNLHIHTMTGDKARFRSIREAIDAAIKRQGGE